MTERVLLAELTEALRCLPGVGAKSAQRIALHLLQRDRGRARHLAHVLEEAMDRIGNCSACRNFTEAELCATCASERRDRSVLCIVEGPGDVAAIERTADYRGLYFVLLGRLSPLDGMGPEELGLPLLARRLDSGEVREVILAMGTTLEGEATAHYVAEMAHRRGLAATRIAYGVPIGGELDWVDGSTLAHALASRRVVQP